MSDLKDEMLYGIPAIASAIGLTDRQVRWLIHSAQLPSFKIGRRVCSRRSSLAAWIEAREGAGRAETKANQEPAPADEQA